MSAAARRAARLVAATAGFVVAAIALLVGTALFALRAAPGEWAQRVAWGPLGIDLSVPALLRVATHPLGMRVLAGSSWRTRYGIVRFDRGHPPETLRVSCGPCVVATPAVAAQPIRIDAVEATIVRGEPNRVHGELRVDRVRGRWQARLAARGAEFEIDVADVPFVDLVAVFGSAVPEAARARIEGRAGFAVRLDLPSRRYAIVPRLDGLAVYGLGTEVLATATPLPACARTPRAARAAAPFGTWLPRAVVAAEDQRFYEHPGYDLAEMTVAWSGDERDGAPARGASTIAQQLAKLLYTGAERSLARKLRELLYAVEIDRTLGKARELQLYLAIAPWGDGQCGGEAAALHYYGKHAAALDAAEAVWLASLLRNPERELERAARGEPIEAARRAAIVRGLGPLGRARREALEAALESAAPVPLPVWAKAAAASAAPSAR